VLAILDKPVVPGVTTCDVVELVREQLVVWVKMVEHKGHILLESRGDDDVENDEEEVNAVISECLPLVYDAGDIVDIEDLVVVLGDRAGDLCDEHLLEGVGAANAVGAWPVMATIGVESSSMAMMLVAPGHEVMM
jgi:hypothetical protein